MHDGAPVERSAGPEPTGAGPPRAARPFLKWAGGKRQLLPQLRRFVPPTFATYHEPFLGSAALFFDLWGGGRLQAARLSDTNAALVGCYDVVRRDPTALVAALRRLEADHRQRGAEHYYAARARFNVVGVRGATGDEGADTWSVEMAALFVYLNRTGFNGLYRLNGRGEFNVPAGRYRNPRICDEDGIHAAAEALRGPGVTLAHAAWQRVLADARPNDLVYFDPPYAPVSATARFTHYTAAGFGDDEQRELAQAVVTLARRGCHVVLSNSTAPLMTTLYEQDGDAAVAGVRAWRVPARRAINAHAAGRGDVMEFIVSNVPPVAP